MRISAGDRDHDQHDIDQARRQQEVAASAHSIRLEGGEVSAEWWQEAEQYIAGKITADDLVNLARQRYGLPPQPSETPPTKR